MTPDILICTRLSDMTQMHPSQDDGHKCGLCGHPVGIYPTGQRALEKWPGMIIRCMPCHLTRCKPTDINVPSGSREEILQEMRESKPVIKQ